MTGTDMAVLVMAKAPRPGRAKTRLIPLLGPDGAARLQATLIGHTTTLACSVAPTFLAVDPPAAVDEVRPLVREGVGLFAQAPGPLGLRMHAGVIFVAGLTGGPVVVVGTDAPTLQAGLLVETGRRLAGGADVVIGPALDGGYYLIGLAHPSAAAFAIDSGLWGGEGVLAATLAALRTANMNVEVLTTLRDLDTPADAAAFAADRFDRPPRTPPLRVPGDPRSASHHEGPSQPGPGVTPIATRRSVMRGHKAPTVRPACPRPRR